VALTDFVDEPRFIESNRIAPYKPRALDVSVVLDLMIHDIDLVHAFVQSPMESVDAVGRRVFSDNIDVANARIRFASGCVANVTSSRISMKTERSLRIFQDDSYVSADLQNKTLTSYRKRGEGPVSGPQDVDINSQSFGDADALMEQARAFLDSVANGTPPLVSGRTGLEALETATVIGDLIRGE
jgi:predicted dehydrogenase